MLTSSAFLWSVNYNNVKWSVKYCMENCWLCKCPLWTLSPCPWQPAPVPDSQPLSLTDSPRPWQPALSLTASPRPWQPAPVPDSQPLSLTASPCPWQPAPVPDSQPLSLTASPRPWQPVPVPDSQPPSLTTSPCPWQPAPVPDSQPPSLTASPRPWQPVPVPDSQPPSLTASPRPWQPVPVPDSQPPSLTASPRPWQPAPVPDSQSLSVPPCLWWLSGWQSVRMDSHCWNVSPVIVPADEGSVPTPTTPTPVRTRGWHKGLCYEGAVWLGWITVPVKWLLWIPSMLWQTMGEIQTVLLYLIDMLLTPPPPPQHRHTYHSPDRS